MFHGMATCAGRFVNARNLTDFARLGPRTVLKPPLLLGVGDDERGTGGVGPQAIFAPTLQRFLALAGRHPAQEVFHADIFVEVGPVDPVAATNQPPMVPFVRRSVDQI
jgi:hypothetical protein